MVVTHWIMLVQGGFSHTSQHVYIEKAHIWLDSRENQDHSNYVIGQCHQFNRGWNEQEKKRAFERPITFQYWLYACVLSHFTHVWLFATPWTVAQQAPPQAPWGSPMHDSWRRLPFPSPGDPSDPGVEPASVMSLAFAGGFFITRATTTGNENLSWQTLFPLWDQMADKRISVTIMFV